MTVKNYSIDYLFITGHSLGSSMAILASLDLKEELGVESFMVGFGGPRVGNKAFSEYYHNQVSCYYRITHSHDPVVRLPPRILNFHHLGNEIYYPNELLNYIFCPESEDLECSEGTFFEIWNIWDHTHYLDLAISKCL